MIEYIINYDFDLGGREKFSNWILFVIEELGFEAGEINYHFVSDEELHSLNMEYLNHDSYTDIISFDYTVGELILGDIFISVDRVKENALKFNYSFMEELCRVMIHGILHYCGFKDETESESAEMREREDWALKLFKIDFQ